MTIQNDITEIYIGYFGRAPDPVGFDFWIGQARHGGDGPDGRPPMTMTQIAAEFSKQPEAKALYPFLANPNIGDTDSFLDSVYLNLFNRLPDEAGREFWNARLDEARGNSQEIGAIIDEIINGAQNDPHPDQTILQNKVAVGLDHVQSTAAIPGFEYTDAAAAAAREVINGVDETPASVEEGYAETDAFIAAGAGQDVNTVPLTSEVDMLTGTAGNDVFSATSATLNDGDAVNGSSGLDTLSLLASSDVEATPSLASVERIAIQVTSDATATIDLSASSGVTEAVVQRGDGKVSLEEAPELVALRFVDGTEDDFAIDYADGATDGDADLQQIAFDGATMGTIELRGNIEAVELALAGQSEADAVQLFSRTDDSVLASGAVSVTGSGSLAAEFDIDDVTELTWNGAAATGAQEIDFSGSSSDLEALVVAYGSGDDLVRFDTAGVEADVAAGDGDDVIETTSDLDGDETIDGGEGRDTLALPEFTVDPDLVNDATGVEILEATQDSDSFKASDFDDIDEFVFSGGPNGGRVTIRGVESEDRFVFASDQGRNDEAVRFDGDRAGQTVTMELRAEEGDDGEVVIKADTNTGNDYAAVGFGSNISAVEIVSSGTNDEANVIYAVDTGNDRYYAFDNDGGPNEFTITGDQALTIAALEGVEMSPSGDSRGFVDAVNLDASGLEGQLRIAASNGADVIVGGSADDIIYGLGGDDALTGNGGADQFRLVGFDSTDTLIDFRTGEDKLGTNVIDFENTEASSEGTVLAEDDYVENRDGITDIGAADDRKVVELQDALSQAQIENDIGAAVEAYVLVYNTTSGNGEVWYDDDWSDGGREHVATFDTVTDLVGVQDFSNLDFVSFTA